MPSPSHPASPRVLALIAPMTQLNTPYPSTAYLTGFLRSRGIDARQADLALALVLELLSGAGLERLRDQARRLNPLSNDPGVLHFLARFDDIHAAAPRVLAFLQGRDPTLAHRIVSRAFVPEGPRFAALEAYADDGSGDLLRLEVSSDFKYELYFGPKKAGDFEVKAGGLTILVDRASAKRANGITIEWVETADGGAFRIDNPAEPPSVKPLSVTELKAWLDRGDKLEIFDVRGDDERARAKIDAAKKFDESAEAYVRTLPKSTTIVMQCHHGGRSRRAAERLVAEGFTRVYNLEGGIDAWSVKVDPKVARY
jgi:rhodanese-related sulfurtransferase/Fe-S cluster assembly iron-binding protein IscA